MDYAEGESLRNSWHTILIYLKDIISGLDAIHESKFVHCDLHDGNILHGFGYYVSDLGISKPN